MKVRALNESLQKKAIKDLNEDPRRTSSDLDALREWIQKQPHLQNVKPTDQLLVGFLRGCKFSLERSKEKIDMYYTLRSIVPEFFADRDPMGEKIQTILKLGVFLPLRECAGADSPRVCINRLGVVDASKVHLADIIKVSLMVTDILILEDDNFGIAGEEVIVDLKDVGMTLISQWTPGLAKKIVTSFEKALPIRLKGNHIVNTSNGFDAAYSIFKMFLSEKLTKRLKVHNKNFKAMHSDLPKKILPKEYGGDGGSVEHLVDYWKQKVESYRDWYLAQHSECSDETKRLGQPKSSSDLFGIEGSFRKLNFD